MAGAMARGWAGAERRPERMLFYDLDGERAESLAAETGGEAVDNLPRLRDQSDVLLLAVKPAALEAVAAELEGRAPALLSVLAVTPLERIGAAFPGVPALRVMPNQPSEVRRGVLCYATGPGMEGELREELVGLLGSLGDAVELPEERLDAAMAVMACAPAYVALFAEALARAGECEGLDARLAAELVRETFAGTAELLGVRDPAAIRTAVAPPGGATERGLEVLRAEGVPEAIEAAVRASLEYLP
jgi:pyrroline-5-carboxylate reductase